MCDCGFVLLDCQSYTSAGVPSTHSHLYVDFSIYLDILIKAKSAHELQLRRAAMDRHLFEWSCWWSKAEGLNLYLWQRNCDSEAKEWDKVGGHFLYC